MSPTRHLSLGSPYKSSFSFEIQDAFLGLAFKLHPLANDQGSRELEYAMVIHDGTGVVEAETFTTQVTIHDMSDDDLRQEIMSIRKEVLDRIRLYETDRGMKICMVALAEPFPEELKGHGAMDSFTTLWLHLDAIPFMTTPPTAIFDRLPIPSPEASASSAIAAGLAHLHPATHTATRADVAPEDHSVLVDAGGKIKLCSIAEYEQSTSPELWSRYTKLAQHLKEKDISIHYFSATPQGGGVALMRHALIRLWKLSGLTVKWFVPEGHPAIFDITKRKLHNVLQGVAEKGIELDDEDKRNFEIWTEQNYEHFWTNGAIEADLIVIDDPQLAPMIPIIKRKRPDAKIIFRSHIQIQSDLTDDPSTPQYRTWNYLFGFIKQVDLFLAHPVKFFVPKNVHATLPVLYMPPSTDPLDGLNKPFGSSSVHYYRQIFNSLSRKQCGNVIDWEREYICQVARFDPSKGYDQLLEAYRQFRARLSKDGEAKGPQLILIGHGSVDDPDGAPIVGKLSEMLDADEFSDIREDVAIVRAPPSDGLLGCIMQGAWVATQLSIREGFEVKVTEIINKRVPVIVYDAGGIPLQVDHGSNGWIVPTGDIEAVANLLYGFRTGKMSLKHGIARANAGLSPNEISEKWVNQYDKPVHKVSEDIGATSEDFWTVGNALKWMYLASQVLNIPLDTVGQSLEQGLEEEGNVWKMAMQEDMRVGEGEIL